MVSVSFEHEGREILLLTAVYGREREVRGDDRWLDFERFCPYSPRLGRKVSWAEDCEEWARSLAAYAASQLKVRVALNVASAGVPAPPHSQRRKRGWLLGVFVLLVLAVVGVELSGVLTRAPRRVPAPPPLLLPNGPATTLLSPAPPTPQQLSASAVRALSTTMNALVGEHNQWALSCVPAPVHQQRSCMLPALMRMNALVNDERVVVRKLEAGLGVGQCRLVLAASTSSSTIFIRR